MNRHPKVADFAYDVLSRNTTGGTSISLTSAAQNLASLKIHTSSNRIVLLSATVGYLAVTDATGLSHVNVLFKIWREDTVIFSVLESSESTSNPNKVISFMQVDADFDSSTTSKYILTAELPGAGSAATVIGPITLTATQFAR